MPKFNFKLNSKNWQNLQQQKTGLDYSAFNYHVVVTIDAESIDSAKNILSLMVEQSCFDVYNPTLTYEIPGSCGNENNKI